MRPLRPPSTARSVTRASTRVRNLERRFETSGKAIWAYVARNSPQTITGAEPVQWDEFDVFSFVTPLFATNDGSVDGGGNLIPTNTSGDYNVLIFPQAMYAVKAMWTWADETEAQSTFGRRGEIGGGGLKSPEQYLADTVPWGVVSNRDFKMGIASGNNEPAGFTNLEMDITVGGARDLNFAAMMIVCWPFTQTDRYQFYGPGSISLTEF